MRINSISYNNTTPTFSAWQRTVYKKPAGKFGFQEINYRNDTTFFREDLIWHHLIEFLNDKYAEISKVNVYNYACSNGSETYSIIMKILSDIGEVDSAKFFPILAKDFDDLAIKNAKSKSIPISWAEKTRIRDFTGLAFNDFFTKEHVSNWFDGDTYFYKPSKLLTDRVEFSKADILKDYKNIESENSVVLARNFWPYLGEDIPKLVANLASKLGKTSTLIIGGFDINGCRQMGINLPIELAKAGFCNYEDTLIYEKF